MLTLRDLKIFAILIVVILTILHVTLTIASFGLTEVQLNILSELDNKVSRVWLAMAVMVILMTKES